MTKIYTLLKQDHDSHREMLAKIADINVDTQERRALFERFKTEVTAHANAEEQALYSEMLERSSLQDEGRHSVAEHKDIDDQLEELDSMEFSDPMWMHKFVEMRHLYEHHIAEEEEEIFVAAKDKLADGKEERLGQEFTQAKSRELHELQQAS